MSIVVVPASGEAALAACLVSGIQSAFGLDCAMSEATLDVAAGFDRFRGQYRSTVLLHCLETAFAGASRVLGVTTVDLFVPVLTFVFGEAQLGGRCAVVSSYRLREELYGLAPDPALLMERLLKEAVHELGHTFGLRHCEDWTCVMHSSHTVERLDLKTAQLCERCRSPFNATAAAAADVFRAGKKTAVPGPHARARSGGGLPQTDPIR